MKTLWPRSILLIVPLIILTCGTNAQDPNLPVSDFEEAISNKDVQLLDVRTASEFTTGHLSHAMQADWLDSAQFRERVSALDKSKPVYTYCLSGGRSGQAMNWLRQNGFTAYNLAGGINAWKTANKSVAEVQSVKQITMQEYFAMIPKSQPVLIDFSADWCPPCIKMAPVLDSLKASQGDKFALLKIDAGAQAEISKQLNVDVLPTFIVYKNGKEVWRKEGIVDMKELKAHL